MMTIDPSALAKAQHVATLLDDLITWRTIGSKHADMRETTNIQPHGGSWMPADRSFDRILVWRTVENNAFQLFEYSMSRNLSHNALQIQFDAATTVLPNVFIVELPEQRQICLMFATHIGVYRWILRHPTLSSSGQLDQPQSILADINDDHLTGRNHFYRCDLQLFAQVTCAYTDAHLIYTLHNEVETMLLRFDNQDYLSASQQLTFPKRQSTGLFNFLWSSNKSVTASQQNQPLITGQTTIIYSTMTMTIVLYDTGLLRFLSDQLDLVIFEHDISADLPRLSPKLSTKMFLDYCQYETHSDELITRLFIALDSNELLHLLIYEFQYTANGNMQLSVYQNKTYTKSLQSTEHAHLPHGSSLTSLTCTNDRLILHLLTNQNRSVLLLVDYESRAAHSEQFLQLSDDLTDTQVNDESTSIDEIERRLNSPGQFTIDMIKEALWITFSLNLDEYNQSWTSLMQILQQLPMIIQSLCRDHCEENGVRDEDRLQTLTKFWQNLYSTLIDLRAHALMLFGCRIFDERQLVVIIHKAAVSLYSLSEGALPISPKYARCVREIEALITASDDDTIARIDDDLFHDTSAGQQAMTTQQLARIQKHLDPVVNNDQLMDVCRSFFERHSPKTHPNDVNNNVFTSKIARRLLVLVFVRICHEKIHQIDRLIKLIPLVFRSSQTRISSHRADRLQEHVLPYLQELLQIYQVLLWLSSRGTEVSSSLTVDDRDLFIENLVHLQPQQRNKGRMGNQSLLEQVLLDTFPQEQTTPDADNWFKVIIASVDNLFSFLWPSNDFLTTFLPSRHQWTILDQYCGKLSWFKELNSARQFFHALTFYRSGMNIDTATRFLAAGLKDLHTDPLLKKMFGRQAVPELFYIEWVREYLKYFGQGQHAAAFLHQSLQSSFSNETRALIIKELFKTSVELKNFDDAFWCIQNTNDSLSQKQFTFEYALAICSLAGEQSLYRLRTLLQYQHDKLGHDDLELLAYLERACVETQPMQTSQVHALYEIYKAIGFPLKMAQIMFHYGCSIVDVKEQKNVLQLALEALSSIPTSHDSTDRLFVFPMNYEYNSIAPLHADHAAARLIGIDECRQKLAIVSAIHTLKSNRTSASVQITDAMHPTQISGLLAKYHYNQEAQQLLDAFKINRSSTGFVH